VHLLIEPGSDTWRINDILESVYIHAIDMIDFDGLKALVSTHHFIEYYHLAAYGGMAFEQDADQIYRVNFGGTQTLLNAAMAVGFELFINTGSSSEYGKKDAPMREDDFLEPASHYAIAKAAATHYCSLFNATQKLPIYTIRPLTVYGPRELHSRLIPTIVAGAHEGKTLRLASPHNLRDFIYVDDIIDAYLILAEKKPAEYSIFNIGSGVESTVADVVATTEKVMHKKLDVVYGHAESRPWEPQHWRADISRAQQVLGWQPKYSLEQGLTAMVVWYEATHGMQPQVSGALHARV
jgi:nucleoside-diphosphate-sugar epimerase